MPLRTSSDDDRRTEGTSSRISWCQPAVLESALELALEIARKGREGHRIGTLFTDGKVDAVLTASRALILDPLAGHAPARTDITDSDLRGTIKELAQLDGAFVISETGDPWWPRVAISTHPSSRSISPLASEVGTWPLPRFPGVLARSPSSCRRAASCVCFMAGKSQPRSIPELWLLDRHHTQLSAAAAGAVEAQRLGTATLSLSQVSEESSYFSERQ